MADFHSLIFIIFIRGLQECKVIFELIFLQESSYFKKTAISNTQDDGIKYKGRKSILRFNRVRY